MILRRLLKNSFFQGSVLFTASSLVVNALNYLFSLLVAKKLGPSGFGEVSSLFSFIAMFSVPMTVMSMVLIQKIGHQKKNQLAYAASLEQWFRKKLARWWYVFVFAVALFPLIQYVTKLTTISSIAVVPLIMIGTVGTFYSSLLQGLHLLGWVSLVSIVVVLIKVTGVLMPIGGEAALMSIVGALAVSSSTMVLLPRLLLRTKLTQARAGTFLHTKRLSHVLQNRQVIITLCSLVSITIISNFDIVMAKRIMTPSQAGMYSAWVLFAKIVLYGLGPVLTMSYIFFSSKKNESYHDRLLLISLLGLTVVGGVVYGIYTYAGHVLVSLLFSSTFTPVVPFLGQASLFGTLYAGTTFLNNYFLSRGSNYALIISIAVIPYIGALVIAGHSLPRFMYANTVVTGLIFIVQLSAVIQYNYARWKQNRITTS